MTGNTIQSPEPMSPEPDLTHQKSILDAVERMSELPDMSVEKMGLMIGFMERRQDRAARIAYVTALSKVQPELPLIMARGGIKDRFGKVQSNYALWEDINREISPVLGKHGFALSFRVDQANDKMTVIAILAHSGGHWEENAITLPLDTSGSKNIVQSYGSTMSYAKRYSASLMLNLASTDRFDHDDDGAGTAGGNGVITDHQASTIYDLITESGADGVRFLAFFGAKSVTDLPAIRFQEAVNMLKARAAKKAGSADV